MGQHGKRVVQQSAEIPVVESLIRACQKNEVLSDGNQESGRPSKDCRKWLNNSGRNTKPPPEPFLLVCERQGFGESRSEDCLLRGWPGTWC